jgi:hypothetical protein
LEKENYWRSRAEGAERRKEQQGDPGVIARRIEKLEAERRKIVKDRASWLEALEQLVREDLGYGKIEEIRLDHVKNAVQDALTCAYTIRTPKPDESADWSCRNAWNEMERSIRTAPRSMRWYERMLAHNELVLSYQKQIYQESGGIPTAGIEIKPGFFVLNHRHWCRVIKVNQKTVTLDYSWLDMPPAKMDITRIKEIQTPEEHNAMRQQSRA